MLKKLLVAVSLFAGAAFAQIETEDSVLVLGDDNLATAVDEHKNILVEFYAPWCGHCKNLAPEYAGAAEFFEDSEDFDVALAKVDATEHPESAQKYGVSGYPTLKFFKNGDVQDYTGGRTKDEIIAWLKKKTGPVAVVVEDAEALEALKEAEDVVIVLAASDITEENKNVANFLKYGGGEDNAAFALTTDFELVGEEAGEDKIVLFKAYDEGRVEYDGKITKSKLAGFVAPHLLPYVVEFNDVVAPKVFGGAVREHILYFRDASEDGDEAVIEEFRTVAKAHQGELLFVAVDITQSSNTRIAEFFGLKEGSYPAARIININATPIKYLTPEGFEFNAEGFEAFVTSYVEGELAPHLNSEEIPESWDEEDVKVIVGKNFEAEVLKAEGRATLLMAYAPWCGHCKSLMPTWEELAEAFEDNENVMIAKMDSTANEVEAFSVQSFPTLKFFQDGEMVDYDGGRTLEDFTTFLNGKLGVEADEAEVEADEAEVEADEAEVEADEAEDVVLLEEAEVEATEEAEEGHDEL